VTGTGNAAVDQDRVQLPARQPARERVHLTGIGYVERLDLHSSRIGGGEIFQHRGLVRFAGGGDHGPAVAQKFLNDSKPDAAIGTNDDGERRVGHDRISFNERVACLFLRLDDNRACFAALLDR
jgi:hypothetical protein